MEVQSSLSQIFIDQRNLTLSLQENAFQNYKVLVNIFRKMKNIFWKKEVNNLFWKVTHQIKQDKANVIERSCGNKSPNKFEKTT